MVQINSSFNPAVQCDVSLTQGKDCTLYMVNCTFNHLCVPQKKCFKHIHIYLKPIKYDKLIITMYLMMEL